MRAIRLVLCFLFAAAAGCRSAEQVPEPGAVLLRVKCPAGLPTPDELRVWVYDDGGRLWDGVRIPSEGPLVVADAPELGTILIAPGAVRGQLRIHVRGLAGGARVLDGLLTVASLANGDRTHDILLTLEVPADADGDGVPDLIDDCPGLANPAQGGCPSAPEPDASVVEAGRGDVATDSAPARLDVEPGPDGKDDASALPGLDGPTVVGPDGPAAVDASIPGDDGGPDGGPDSAPDVPTTGDLVLPGGETGPVMDVASVDAGVGGGDTTGAVDGDADAAIDVAADAAALDGGAGCEDAGESGRPQGALCAADGECASGFCVDGVCCISACQGPCRSCNQPSTTGVCQGYASGTDPEVECPSGSFCNGVGACGPVPPPNLPNGELCTSPSQCLSGFCKDGVCCDTDCLTPCMACGSGTCQIVKRTDDVPECTDTMTCNQKGTCVAR